MNTIQLVNIQEYADKWQLHRNTIHNLMNDKKITIYLTPKGRKFLNPNEIPPRETLVKSIADNKASSVDD